MPGMDGVTLARAIKADARINTTALVMMTSMASLSAEEAKAAGIVRCVAKPLKLAQVRECLLLGLAGVAPKRAERPDKPQARTGLGRILVAEDNAINQKVVPSILRSLGFSADAVGNGVEAVEALRTVPYDLVLMDCQMPEMDGYDATQAIRRLGGRFAALPIIAMTAHAMTGDRLKCLDAGMDDYLSKPVKLPDLERTVTAWIGREHVAQGGVSLH